MMNSRLTILDGTNLETRGHRQGEEDALFVLIERS